MRQASKHNNGHCIFAYSGIPRPEEDSIGVGEQLVADCLRQVDDGRDAELFPPRLFLLLVSPIYLEGGRAEQLFAGIRQTLRRKELGGVPIIGSSTAAVMFDRAVHPEGALLVCLASRFLEAQVATVSDVSADPAGSMRKLAEQLDVLAIARDPNQDANRSLLVFFPGRTCGVYPSELHRCLLEAVMYRIPISGGVSSTNDPTWSRPPLQFDADGVHTDSVTAARIQANVPVAASLSRGLKKTGQKVRVKRLTDDGRAVAEFEGVNDIGVLAGKLNLVLFGNSGLHEEDVIAVSVNGRPANQNRPVEVGQELEVLEPDEAAIRRAAQNCYDATLARYRIQRPEGSLSFRCASIFRHASGIGLDISAELEQREEALGAPIVGAFLDGEAGTEESGRSVLANWAAVRVIFADELRDRGVRRVGYEAIAKHMPDLTQADTLPRTIQVCLSLVRAAGFRDGMISLLMGRGRDRYVVAQGAAGPRWEMIVGDTRRRLDENDILAMVARSGTDEFVPVSSGHPHCDQPSVVKTETVSQYVAALLNEGGKSFGILQVDLGDVSREDAVRDATKDVLRAMTSTIATAILRAMELEGARIHRALEDAYHAALLCPTLKSGLETFIRAAVTALDATGGHIRIWNHRDNALHLAAGVGPYYELARQFRKDIDTSDSSRTGEAFSRLATYLINDAQSDTATGQLLGNERTPEALKEQIRRIGSFVNTVFEKGRVKGGTISIHSNTPWFFHSYHESSAQTLSALGGLLAYELENRERQERRDAELSFLLETKRALTRRRPELDLDGYLDSLIAGIRRVSRADVASLYLWDERTGRYILRAKDGWADPNWIGASRYKPHQGWTGSMALEDGPRVFDDLNRYKRRTNRTTFGSYGKQIWGDRVSAASNPQPTDGEDTGGHGDLRVRALALPLRGERGRFGVVTLLIGEESAPPRNFLTEATGALGEVADQISAHLDAALCHQEWTAGEDARKARDEVLRRFSLAFHEKDLEPADALCLWTSLYFHAETVRFYYAPPGADLTCVGAFPESVVRQVDAGVRAAFRGVEPDVETVPPPPTGCDDPIAFAREGVIRRMWILTRVAGQPAGVLALTWPDNRPIHQSSPGRAALEELRSMSRMVGAMYQKHLEGKQREQDAERQRKSDAALKAMSAMINQSGHRLKGLLQQLTGLQNLAETGGHAGDVLERLAATIKAGKDTVVRPLQIARSVVELRPGPVRLKPLVDSVLQNASVPPGCRVSSRIDDDCILHIEEELTRAAFENIVSNAVMAVCKKEKRGVLEITSLPKAHEVQIVFEDSGVGMTPAEADAALTGFVETARGTGFGVLLARVLVEVQGGSFELRSTKGVGTRVTISLPCEEKVR